MKRKIASRKIKRKCNKCNRSFKKGEVYYITRVVHDFGEVVAYEFLTCPKCKYKDEQREKRYERFQETCKHKPEFINMVYSQMWGECIAEPSHEECFLCNRVVF